MAKVGRPRKHDPETVMAAVCARIASGELVKDACRHVGIDPTQVRDWALTDQFSPLYTRARIEQAHAMAEGAVEIADGADGLGELLDQLIDLEDDRLAGRPERYKVIQSLKSERVNRDRIRMDARKWLVSKIAPKLYGDRQAVEVTGESGGPIVIKFVHESSR